MNTNSPLTGKICTECNHHPCEWTSVGLLALESIIPNYKWKEDKKDRRRFCVNNSYEHC